MEDIGFYPFEVKELAHSHYFERNGQFYLAKKVSSKSAEEVTKVTIEMLIVHESLPRTSHEHNQ
ncbi:hypothetical protein NRD16_002134 [Photobacterium damselae]|nr:hypothetical protein [Photobacterium damselae]